MLKKNGIHHIDSEFYAESFLLICLYLKNALKKSYSRLNFNSEIFTKKSKFFIAELKLSFYKTCFGRKILMIRYLGAEIYLFKVSNLVPLNPCSSTTISRIDLILVS